MMTRKRIRVMVAMTAAFMVAVLIAGAAEAQAVPVKEILTAHFGAHVDANTGGNVCTVGSGHTCQPGQASAIAGGFQDPEGVAGAPAGDVYITDGSNHRVQELSAGGEFVLMFGDEVNQTKDNEPGATQAEKDLCTAASKDVCKAGVASGASGQIEHPYSIAVDPSSGDLYVAERVLGEGTFGQRVQKLTPDGQFVWEIGREVNETKDKQAGATPEQRNLCTREEEVKEGVKCTVPTHVEPGSAEHGALNFEISRGDLLAVGSAGELYVGDEGRTQVFKSNGEWERQIALAPGAQVRVLALDDASGALYVALGEANVIERFDAEGHPSGAPIEVQPSEPGVRVYLRGIAIDSQGHLAVAGEEETFPERSPLLRLYEASTARPLTSSRAPGRVKAVGFNGQGQLYGPTVPATGEEILAYTPVPVAEVTTGSAPCSPGAIHETDVSIDCELTGEVNPEGVPATEAWFEWGGGRKELNHLTPPQKVAVTSKVQESVAARPNTDLCYQLAGEDANVEAPEDLQGGVVCVVTPLVAAEIIGPPQASFVKTSSVVMSSELNPENASTETFFEYAPATSTLTAICPNGVRKEECPGVATTSIARVDVYGKTGTTLEATGLQPNTTYHYRLSAESENEAKTDKTVSIGTEGSFTTASTPEPSAQTGPYGALSPTTATISATIEPGGVPTSYAFELGVYNRANTEYGVVVSEPVGLSDSPVERIFQLTGLQPGTTYAYRVSITSSYINNETHRLQGVPITFTTPGLAVVLEAPTTPIFLPMPPVAFPAEPVVARVPRCGRGRHRDRHGLCVKNRKKPKHGKAMSGARRRRVGNRRGGRA